MKVADKWQKSVSFLEINKNSELLTLSSAIIIISDTVKKIKTMFVIYASARSLNVYFLMWSQYYSLLKQKKT